MEFTEHRCRNCGGQLTQTDASKWRCPYCSSVFDDSSITRHAESMSKLFDEAKQETINNLRRNLYDATHAEYISSIDVHSACLAIKQYLPDDFQASFYEIAAGNNVKQITKAIRRINAEENFDDIEGIVQFLIRSLQTEYLLELNNLIARAFEYRDPVRFEKYCTELSLESVKVQMGVYETKYPREVFVAYSSKDMDKVSELVETLEAQGMKCFVAARNLRHGKGAVENYNQALEEAMDHCKSFVFVSSMNSRSFNCDALTIELPYIQKKDTDNAPAEYKNNYVSIPVRYKKPRVEYRIGESTANNAADTITGEFFDGYERVYTPDEVAQRIMKQLIATPQAESFATQQVKYIDMDQKKICASCGAENPINTKFCGECGKNEFVNSVSELIKLRKMQEANEKAKNDAAIAEAEKAAEAARAEAEQAKRDAEAKAAKAAAAERAKKEAEEKAKAAEEAKAKAAIANAGVSSTYSNNTSSYSAKPKKKAPVAVWVIIGIVGVIVLAIISGTLSNQHSAPSTNQGESETANNSSNATDTYPNFIFNDVSGGLEISVDPEKRDNISGELVIPSEVNGKKVVAIAESGFLGCSQITSVTVPDTVTTIGFAAFNACPQIKEITIPFVGKSANATGEFGILGHIFGNKDYSGCYTATQHYNSDAYMHSRLPQALTTVNVTSAKTIPWGAFYDCDNLKEINLNNGITEIGECAFYGCAGIEKINLPDLLSISDYAFYDCSSLTEFDIGDSVESIGKFAFAECTSLSRIDSETNGTFVIGEQVESIGYSAFNACTQITDITLPFIGSSKTASGEQGLFGYIFGYDDYSGCVTATQYYNDGSYKYVRLPGSLSKVTITADNNVEYGAFDDCDFIDEIILNAEITSVGNYAFRDCSSITAIELPNITQISEGMLQNCSSLKSFTIGSAVTEISTIAFSGCSALSTVNSENAGCFVIPDTVTSIGEAAFKGCSLMNDLTVPFIGKSQTSTDTEGLLGHIFGYNDFGGAYVAVQDYNNSSYKYSRIPSNLKKVTVTLDSGIEYGAFSDCTSIEEINLPESVTYISALAFSGCTSLEKIAIPSGVTTIKEQTFAGCTSLQSIEIHDNIKSIETLAFNGCTGLIKVNSDTIGKFVIGSGVTEIGVGAFRACSGMQELVIPFVGASSTATGEKALFGHIFGYDSYSGCYTATQYYNSGSYKYSRLPGSLVSVTVTNATSIGYGAFSDCSNLTSITINTSAQGSVHSTAFDDCNANVTYADYEPEVKE